MLGRSRVRLGVSVLAVVIGVATCWYALVEDFAWIDALYQTLTTVSTVGFREIEDLDTGGRVFTMAVILVGVGAMLYTVTSLFEEMVEEQVGRLGRRRMQRKIEDLDDHVVVCGYGRVGRTVARLLEGSLGVVVIDSDPSRAAKASDAGLPAVEGDATDDAVLKQAGIERAAVLVAALPTDADNVYIVLSGKAVNPGMHIVARARAEASESTLLRAGADRVINPQEIGGRRMAAFALQPTVSEFLDVVVHGGGEVEYRLQEIAIPETAPLVGRTIRDAHIRDSTGALVLALRTDGGNFLTNPPPETSLEAGMTVIAIGTPEQLSSLQGFVDGGGDGQ